MAEIPPVDTGEVTTTNEDEAFDEVIAGAMSSFATTLMFPLIQKTTEDIRENSNE
ncbi:hypothetical protein GCM10007276_11820 [Agaricicola taiwanensis]|uniref:Uncharacterized protein n=1 Tax=Agaricicola taiwanensis TaxID=591372 RepID=A0A8J2VLB5_9RHOB|nr:hypothetical protein [Agaricicola taiwanensis]GGE35993.1 hypothetical protein GCM10007276_11820 [Agaricicola taiwanensis]